MSQLIETIAVSIITFTIGVCAVLMAGDPDLSDAIRRYIDAKTELMRCK